MTLPVTSGLIAHLKASSLTLNQGDLVTVWPDSSGVGNDFDLIDDHITGMEAPVYNATAAPGNRPAVYFGRSDGTPAGTFTKDQALAGPASLLDIRAATVFAFAAKKARMASGNSHIFTLYEQGVFNSRWYMSLQDGPDAYYTRTGTVDSATQLLGSETVFRVYAARGNGNNKTAFINGAVAHSYTDTQTTAALTRCTLGTLRSPDGTAGAADALPLDGPIAEFLVYSRALTNQEIEDVSAYLLKLAPTLSLPGVTDITATSARPQVTVTY